MHIVNLKLKNFRVFKNVEIRKIPKMSIFVGANGTGKSTLFDVFGFLRDSLIHNVRQATRERGGFSELRSRDANGPIEIEIKFRTDEKDNLATYYLAIDAEKELPYVAREILKYRRYRQYGSPWHFLDFKKGKGTAIENEAAFEDLALDIKDARRVVQELDSPDILAIKSLGQLTRFQKANAFRKLIENWHISDFRINDAKPSQEVGLAEHLSERGDNAALMARFLYEHRRDVFDQVLDKLKRRIPGVDGVDASETEDGRVVLKFRDGAFKDPFIARYASDGTIKMFAYLLLLYDPSPHPLLCVEEPENQLYPKLLMELAEEFRDYSMRGGQVFVSSHSPVFLNAAELEEVFWLQKGEDGFTRVHRAGDHALIRDLVSEGDMPGVLWEQGLFGRADPR